jgi:hypothetical protein
VISDAERRINEAAVFLPQVDDDTLPCLMVGGVQVYAYFGNGELVISAHYDTADDAVVNANKCVPTRVNIGGTDVYHEH